ncbi:MAG: serine/threonine-protein kinase [Myxococcota bacterium]
MDRIHEQPTLDGSLDEATHCDAGAASTVVDGEIPAIGGHLGHYLVLDRLGSGAMGTVVEAHDQTLDRRVAIKLLQERRGERQERRLLREAQALARLSHPNVVQVYEVGEANGRLFIAMELVVGQTLDRWLARPRAWRETLSAYVQAGEGLAAAHAEGLVHRDFKPSNCIIDERGRVKVLDFGLARESGEHSESTIKTIQEARLSSLASLDGSQRNRALSEALTRTGALMGTPAYMAPEQLMGRGAGAHSDQFNFCVALYEALYGTRPFPQSSIGELINEVLNGTPTPPSPRAPGPRGLWPVLRRGLARRPTDRWPSMPALLRQLQRVSSRRAHRRWLMVTGLAAATAGGVMWGRGSHTPCRGAEARMAEVWDASRSGAVGDALMATELSYADATRERVIAGLDEYATRWIHSHTAACEATQIHGEQSAERLDLRMQCLEQGRTAMSHAVQLLEAADPAMVEHAVSMVSSLPSISRCDHARPATPATPTTLATPNNPTDAAELDALRERLATTAALVSSGRLPQAHAVVDPVVDRAGAVGYGPVRVDARLARGRVRHRLGRYEEAQTDLATAYELALELGDDEAAARASQELTVLEGHALARPQVGRTWGRTAEALARRIDPEGSLHAYALRSTAIVQFDQSEIEGAAERFEQALRISLRGPLRSSIYGGEPTPLAADLDLARALGDMGNLRTAQGRLEEALGFYARATMIRLERLGPGHPDLAEGAINVGRIYEMQGKLDEAAVEYQRALELWQSARGADHPDVAIALNNLAVVHDKQGRPDTALALYDRVLTMRRAALGPSHPYVAQTLSNMGLAWRAQGKLERALSYFQDALALFELHEGRDGEQALYELCETERQLGRLEDARAHCERFWSQVAAHEDEQSHQLAFAEFALAQVKWAQDQRADARATALRSMQRVDAAGPPGEELRRQIAAWLAEHPVDR